jgi:hypothetical protein
MAEYKTNRTTEKKLNVRSRAMVRIEENTYRHAAR